MNYKKLILESEDGIVFEITNNRNDSVLPNITLDDSKKVKRKKKK